ncbi:hypothetical protein K2173_003423 [Erythroxylum novogranatense]|uniref:Calcineurin B-like protein n=1 Tax=Erythroxylum novogranatense TaxID=1862640 RepID=A0AAV8S8P7_9ROSI|nr:hypothetical protein K2173_003423 [Erythroxylum novogranatense]
MGANCMRGARAEQEPELDKFSALAAQTPFSVDEVQALYELYKKVSSSIVQDGFIRKVDLQCALFRNSKKNLFVDRMFNLFDVNCNGYIDFGEFVQSMSVFHPRTPEAVKKMHLFKLYDLGHTGYIEHEELKEMVLALLDESDLILSDDIVKTIVDKTFSEADTKGDGRIDQEEWGDYVARNPSLLKNMTLPYLMDITLVFPSFGLGSEEDQSQQ